MKCLYRIANVDVYQFTMPIINSNMYVMIVGNEALIIDPCISKDAERILSENCVDNCLILLSHEHYDHISGVNRLRNLCKCKVLCSQKCSENIICSKKNGATTFGALFIGIRDVKTQRMVNSIWNPVYSCYADIVYDSEVFFKWKNLNIHVIETPGHSPGSSIIEINDVHKFTGDSLIPNIPTITRLPGGDKDVFNKVTLPYISKFNDDSIIYPGHGEITEFKSLRC